MATRKTILLNGPAREQDFNMEVAIGPGMLVQRSASDAGAVELHAVAGGAALPMFLREQHEDASSATVGGIDNNVVAGGTGTVLFPQLGAVINCRTADTILAGEWIESAGNGLVRLWGSGYRIGQAQTASDLSGTVGRVEVVIAPIGL
jgi:hypothetical protein